MSSPRQPRTVKTRGTIYGRHDGNHTLLWLQIQYVSLTLEGHQAMPGAATQITSEAVTYLVPVTTVASIRMNPTGTYGDYAAYIGVAPPTLTTDLTRVSYIASRGNKIERSLAEHLFRERIDAIFGKGVVIYRD
jgi:hypothetical protein